MALIQFRVDDDLKNQATEVYEKIGIDISTAMRMFLKKCVSVNGIPFSLLNSDTAYVASKGVDALESMQKVSKANGNSKMTIDQINDEISLSRKLKNE